MPAGRRLAALILYGIVLLVPAGVVPLTESTEARYGEIAREMAASGDYLEPRFNGIKHFHKPPLAYWMVAAGIRIFGPNGFGTRFFGVVAACVAVLFLYRTALVLLEDERKAFFAALIYSSSILFLAVSRIVSTEIYLACFTVTAQYGLFRRLRGDRRPAAALLYAVSLALGFLVKGPIILLFTLLPFLAAKPFDREHRKAFSRGEILAGLALFLAIALPWFLAVAARNQGLLHYFLKVHVLDRAVTDRFLRYQPPWYFLPILFGTFLPYTFFLAGGLRRFGRLSHRSRILLIYVLVPLVVLSLVKGKHATYILPFYGLLAVVTADIAGSFALPRARAASLALLGVIAAAPVLAGFIHAPFGEFRVPLAIASAAAFLLLRQVWTNRTGDGFLPWTASLLLLAGTVGMCLLGAARSEGRGYEEMAGRIDALNPDRRMEILVYREFLPSLSFYREELAVMALGGTREVLFEEDGAYRRHYIDSPEGLRVHLRYRPELFVVARPENIDTFRSEYRYGCTEIYRQRKHAAYFCRREPAPALRGGQAPPMLRPISAPSLPVVENSNAAPSPPSGNRRRPG